eukprot:5526-Pelagococcus_subviridis.AAC.5
MERQLEEDLSNELMGALGLDDDDDDATMETRLGLNLDDLVGADDDAAAAAAADVPTTPPGHPPKPPGFEFALGPGVNAAHDALADATVAASSTAATTVTTDASPAGHHHHHHHHHQRTASVDADANGKPPEPSEMMVKAVAILRAANAAGHSIPQEFFDCITTDIMLDPVIAWDGHTYERGRWLREHSTSPMTGETLPDFTLRPNHSMRSQIINHGEKLERQGVAGA